MSASRSIAERISGALVGAGPRSCATVNIALLRQGKTRPVDAAINTTAASAVLDDAFGLFFWKREFCGIELQTQLQVCVFVPWKRYRVLTCIARRAVALSP